MLLNKTFVTKGISCYFVDSVCHKSHFGCILRHLIRTFFDMCTQVKDKIGVLSTCELTHVDNSIYSGAKKMYTDRADTSLFHMSCNDPKTKYTI